MKTLSHVCAHLTHRLAGRITAGVALENDHGADGPLGFVCVFPIWFAAIGLIFVLGYWYWAQALNAAGVAGGARLAGLGGDPNALHSRIVRAGLGGYARDYDERARFAHTGRAVVGSVESIVRISPFPVPRQVTVRAASVGRIEDFYARPPETNAWE